MGETNHILTKWRELEAQNSIDLAEAQTLAVGPQTFGTALKSNKKFNYAGVILFEWEPRKVPLDLLQSPSRGIHFVHDLEQGLMLVESLQNNERVKGIVGVWVL